MLWNISEQIPGTTGHHGLKAKGCQRHFSMCDVAQHAEDILGKISQGTAYVCHSKSFGIQTKSCTL